MYLKSVLNLAAITVTSVIFVYYSSEPFYPTPSESFPIEDLFESCNLTIFDPFYKDMGMAVRYQANPSACCNRSYTSPTILKNGKIFVNPERFHEFSSCRGRCYTYVNTTHSRPSNWTKIEGLVAMNCDFFKTECFRKENKSLTESWLHMQVFENSQSTVDRGERIDLATQNRPDVLIFIMDSVASTHAKRSLPRTLSHLETTMGGRHFHHLNKVGDNSRPNAFAILFGLRIFELKRKSFGGSNMPSQFPQYCTDYLDNQTSFISRMYEETGYKTLFSDDFADGSAFTYFGCKGFKYPEANHIFNTFVTVMSREKALKRTMSPKHCIEMHELQFNYTQMFLNSYEGFPKFAVTWNSYLAHGDPNFLNHGDDVIMKFFADNREQLENSFIFLMGDHGPRYGATARTILGAQELKNPLLFVVLPKWLRQNEQLQKIMEVNSKRLLTQYDVYATLIDILKYLPDSNFTDFTEKSVLGDVNENNGTSIFRPFPRRFEKRNCQNIPLDNVYCMCQYRKENVSDGHLTSMAGASVIAKINHIIRAQNLTDLCTELRLEMVATFEAFAPSEKTRTYEILLIAQPGGGVFRTVIKQNDGGDFTADGDILRLNLYGNQADCIKKSFPNLATYCYCAPKEQTTTRKE